MELTPFFRPPNEGKEIAVSAGDKAIFKATNQDTNGAYTLLHRVVMPGHGPKKHYHTREEEAFFILKGEFSFEVGEQFYKGEAGTFVFGPRTIPHKYWNSGNSEAEILILLTPGGLDPFYFEFYQALEEAPYDEERLVKIAEKYGIFFVD